MPFNGSGIYEPIAAPDFPAVPLTTIRAAQYNAQILDMAQALGQCLTRTGEGPALANLPMGGYQFTGLGTPSTAGQALVFGQNGTLATLTATAGAQITGNASVSGTLAMGSAFENRNLLINGDFNVWQRGASGTAPVGAYTYTADRWTLDPTGAAVTWNNGSSDATGYPTSGSSLTVTGAAGNTGVAIRQRIEAKNVSNKIGKQITYSAWVFCNGAGVTVTPTLSRPTTTPDDYSLGTVIETGSAQSVAQNTWQYKTFTFAALPAGAVNGVRLDLALSALGAGVSFVIDKVQLEEGSVATPFVSRPYGQELALCQRYCTVLSERLVWNGTVTSGVTNYATIPFPRMRAAPTVSSLTSGGNSGFGPTSIGAYEVDFIRAQAVASATGQGVMYCGCTLTAEL